jgi:pimeloyl-ACP methyl ester carboxylesterase
MPAAIRTGNYAELPHGIRLHYASCGKAGRPLLLCLHGFPEYWGAWEEVLPAFGDRHFAVAPDLRGFNLSSQPADVKAYRAREIVADVLALIRALGYRNAFVVAHDWGGAIAWQLAIAHPDVVARLVMLNSPHPIPFARELAGNPAQREASEYMNWLRAPGSEGALASDDFALLERFLRHSQRADRAWLTPERAARYRQAWAHGLTGGVNYYRASPLYPPSANDPGAAALQLDPAAFVVRVPTLVLWGMQDPALLPALLDGLDDVVPDLTIERLDRATHWLVHEEPQFIANRVLAFFDAA